MPAPIAKILAQMLAGIAKEAIVSIAINAAKKSSQSGDKGDKKGKVPPVMPDRDATANGAPGAAGGGGRKPPQGPSASNTDDGGGGKESDSSKNGSGNFFEQLLAASKNGGSTIESTIAKAGVKLFDSVLHTASTAAAIAITRPSSGESRHKPLSAWMEMVGGSNVGNVPTGMQREWTRRVENAKDFAFSWNPMRKIDAATDMVRQSAEMPWIVKAWGEELSRSQEHLKNFNATIGTAYAVSDRRRLQREIVQGREVSGSVSYREEKSQDLQDSLRKYDSLVTNVTNRIQGFAASVTDSVLRFTEEMTQIDKLVEAINSLIGEDAAGKNQANLGLQFMQDVYGAAAKSDPDRFSADLFAGRATPLVAKAGGVAGAAAGIDMKKMRMLLDLAGGIGVR